MDVSGSLVNIPKTNMLYLIFNMKLLFNDDSEYYLNLNENNILF